MLSAVLGFNYKVINIMRGVKAKALRRQARATTGSGTVDAVYTKTKIGRKPCGVIQLGNGMSTPNMVERHTRILEPGCTRAVYQSLK